MTTQSPHRPPSRAQLRRRAADWNRSFPIGSPVKVYRTTRRDDLKCETTTRSEAFVDQSGTSAVVFLEGIAGYWSLDCLVPVRRNAS